VLRGDRADDLASELAAVLLPLDLLVTQAEVHWFSISSMFRGYSAMVLPAARAVGRGAKGSSGID
jgi:hypothetical protein